jgi:hypothetical protein
MTNVYHWHNKEKRKMVFSAKHMEGFIAMETFLALSHLERHRTGQVLVIQGPLMVSL